MIAICKYFLFLGATGFGGPLSLIQQMRQHFVDETKEISASQFDQAFALIKAMPGPIAFQMAVFCTHFLAGRLAAIAAGICLILPAFLLMILAGVGYQFLTDNIYITELLIGFQFSVAAIILLSLKTFFLQYYKKLVFWFILIISAVLFFLRIAPEPVLIVGFGMICAFGFSWITSRQVSVMSVTFLTVDTDVLWKLFKVCTYSGAFVFGTGLALLPVLQEQFITQYHWLNLQVFNDGVTFGQMTPGPITITATFLGYKIAGFSGAILATIGIFLIPLFHMITWFPKVLNWLGQQTWISNFLLGATSAVVGILLITIFKMNENNLHLPQFWFIFVGTLLFLLKKPKTAIYKIIFCAGIVNLIISFATMNTI